MSRPNILWICTDQQRFDSLRCYGNNVIDTPNIDELASSGVLFEHAFCQSPVCSPSRASFLTGRYPHTTRLRQNGQRLPADEVLVSKIFAEAGYSVGLVGKLHLAPCATAISPDMEPRGDDGYDFFEWSHHPDFLGAKSNWPNNAYNVWLTSIGERYKRTPYKDSQYIFVGPKKELSHSHWCANEAISFMSANGSYPRQPWFLSLNFYDPHHDFDPPERLLEKYIARLREIPLPDYVEGELASKSIYERRDHLGAYGNLGSFAFPEMSENDHLLVRAAYYAMVEQIDQEVGRIIDALKSTGQCENTVIIFTSDHGEMLGDHGIYLKGPYFYEPMVRVPFIISWPGEIHARRVSETLMELVDVAPTIMELAGLPSSKSMQGKSLMKVLNGDSNTHRDSAYTEFYNAMGRPDGRKAYGSMLRTMQYKLIYYHDLRFGELYDLSKDPKEFINLFYSEEHTQVRVELMEQMLNTVVFSMDPSPEREAQY